MSKTAYVLARLREDLAADVIQPGQQLRQVEIAARYGVSATPVREALRLLEADGTIRYSPHRGATVTELTPTELSDLYLVRSTVEALLTGMAADRATPQEVEKLRKMHENLAGKSDTASATQLSKLNRDFHLAILRVGSPLVTQHVVEPLWKGFLPPSKSQWRTKAHNDLSVAEHEQIILALEAGDADAAKQHMADHVGAAGKRRESDSGLAADQ